MDKESSRNTIIFIVCALLMFLLYQQFVLGPAQKRQRAAESNAEQTVGKVSPDTPLADALVPLEAALAQSPRVPLETPGDEAGGRGGVYGSVALKGARLDHLFLRGYRVDVDKPEEVELLRPGAAEFSHFVSTGWTAENVEGLPGRDTLWRLTQGERLTPASPIVLQHDAPGLTFIRRIEVDERSMFTITDQVRNDGAAPVTLAAYAAVERRGLPPVARGNTAAEGYVRLLGGEGELRLKLRRYRNWKKDGPQTLESDGGWLGLSDKYWVTALIPQQSDHIRARLGVTTQGGVDIFDATYANPVVTIAPGETVSETHRVFAGAKRAEVLVDYQNNAGVPRFFDAIDWGFGYFITKPLFWLIKWFEDLVGNFGVAILMTTVVVKLVFFYPANLSFESMTKMKKVAPEMEKLKARHKEDPAALQQAMMKLYRDEKINPLLGCLPMLATIPVFLALFHVLNTTIEMRHAPFFGWIQDLSARDPLTIWNLYTLLPYNPAEVPFVGGILDGFLHLGPWPLLYGLTMWLTQSMSPPAADPTQKMIMQWLPVIFTFILAGFPAGLLIYYTWSNLLTILQQYVIMRRFKVDNPIDGAIRRITGKPAPSG